MPEKFAATDPAVLAAYRRMIDAVPEVALKGATTPYTSVNGNMFSSVSKANVIGLRLPAGEREAFIEKHKTTLYEALPGFFQKEYVAVPAALLKDAAALARYFKMSYAHAVSLKPKATTRKKPAAKRKIAKKKTAVSKKKKAPAKKKSSAKKRVVKKKAAKRKR